VSARKPGAGEDTSDRAAAPFVDDAARAEFAWLLAREDDPGATAPTSKIASDYAELEDLLGDLPSGTNDESWQEEVLRTVASSTSPSRSTRRRPIARWMTGGAAAVTAAVAIPAAVVAVSLLWPRPRAGELEVAILHVGNTRSDPKEVVVGDRLVARAQPRGAGDLRVFRSGGTLVAKCPGGPGCSASAHGEQLIEITLDAPVQYQVVLVVGMSNASLDGTMDAYLDAARAAHARILMYQPIDAH
jgi:hypothetical protein